VSRDDELRGADDAEARFDELLDARLRSGWWPLVPEPVHGVDEVAGVVDGLLFLSPAEWPDDGDTNVPTTTLVVTALDELIDSRMRTGEWPLAPSLLDEHSGEVAGVVEALLSLAPDAWPADDSVSERSSSPVPTRALHRPRVRTRDRQGTRHPRPSRVLAAAAAVVLVAGAATLVLSGGPAGPPGTAQAAEVQMVVTGHRVKLVAARSQLAPPAGVTSFTCETPTACVAVAAGPNGPVTATSNDGGKRWRERAAPTGLSSLAATTCVDGAHCWAVGRAGGAAGIIASHDGGKSWASQPAPTGAEALSAVTCPDANVCFAAGSIGGSPSVLSTTNGGATWTTVSLPAGISNVASIGCTSDSQCAAAGSADGSPVLLDTADGGATWNLTTVPSPIVGVSAVLCSVGSPCAALGQNADGSLSGLSLTGPGSWQVLPLVQSVPGVNVVISVPCTTSCPGPGLVTNAALNVIDHGAQGGFTTGSASGVFTCLQGASNCWAVGLTSEGYAAAAVATPAPSG